MKSIKSDRHEWIAQNIRLRAGVVWECFRNARPLAELLSAVYCHRAAEIRAVSADNCVFYQRQSSSNQRDRGRKYSLYSEYYSRLPVYTNVEPPSLPDKAVVVSAERDGTSILLWISVAGARDSREDAQGCSAGSFPRCFR